MNDQTDCAGNIRDSTLYRVQSYFSILTCDIPKANTGGKHEVEFVRLTFEGFG